MPRTCTLSEREGLRCLRRHFDLHAGFSPTDPLSSAAIHDLRIACRRGRVILSEFKSNFSPAASRHLRRLLRKTGRRLGRVREVDVSLSLLDRWMMPDPERTVALALVRRQLGDERQAAQSAVNDTFEKMSGDELAQALARLEDTFLPSTACYLRHARKRLSKRLKRLRQQYRAWRDSHADDDLHLLRIRFKMLRYTLEVHRDLYGNPAKDCLQALAAAQDALGRWNDYRLLRDRVHRAAAGVDSELRDPLEALAAAIDSDTAAAVAAMDDQLKPFLAKNSFRRYAAFFAAPKRACCRGAR